MFNVLIFCWTFCLQIIHVTSNCGTLVNSIPEAKAVNETQTGVVWSVVIDHTTNWTFEATKINENNIPVQHRKEVQNYFDFNKTENENTTYLTFSIARALDKEDTFWMNVSNGELKRLDFQLLCYQIDGSSVPKGIFLPVSSVNEFKQTLNNSLPKQLEIPEDTARGNTVFRIFPYIIDKDIPKPVRTDYTYIIANRTGVQNDGSPWFHIPVASSDGIEIKQQLDFDKLNKENRSILPLLVIITASDKPDFQVNTTLTIKVIDVDDLPPYFLYPGCNDDCPSTPFTTLTYSNYRGILTTQPRDIKAQDRDTLNAPIIYSIVASPTNYHKSFQINPSTAEIRQIGNINTSYVLQIMATEDTSNRHFQTATLLIKMSNDSWPSFSLSQNKDDSGTLRLIAIIVGAVSLVIIGILIFLIVFVHKKTKRKMLIEPQSENIVSPKTSIEDLVSDKPATIDEKVNKWNDDRNTDFKQTIDTNYKQTLDPQQWPTVQGRGFQLDPLTMRDESTETDESKKKKPRKKKKKLMEIFDGTKKFEDKADPEFYTNPDKTKIKRSTKSKHRKGENGILEVTSD